MELSYTGVETRMACWEAPSHVCGEICLALAEVRRRTPLAGLRGTPGERFSGPSSMGPRHALLLLLRPPSPPPPFPSTPAPPHPYPCLPLPSARFAKRRGLPPRTP